MLLPERGAPRGTPVLMTNFLTKKFRQAKLLHRQDCNLANAHACKGHTQEQGFAVIELQDASYGFGDGDLFTGINLQIQPGSFYFLTGPSGAGKTTFLRLCYLDLFPTSGQVSVFGRPHGDMGRDDIAMTRRRVGVVHQNCQFLDHLNVEDNVALPMAVSDVTLDKGNLDQLIDWVGLGHRRHAKPPELSGGERQRAALARAVIMSPDVVIADEPTGNVDWDMSLRLLHLLVELNAMGKTILFATHDLNLIRSAKAHVTARVLRLRDKGLQLAGADL